MSDKASLTTNYVMVDRSLSSTVLMCTLAVSKSDVEGSVFICFDRKFRQLVKSIYSNEFAQAKGSSCLNLDFGVEKSYKKE